MKYKLLIYFPPKEVVIEVDNHCQVYGMAQEKAEELGGEAIDWHEVPTREEVEEL